MYRLYSMVHGPVTSDQDFSFYSSTRLKILLFQDKSVLRRRIDLNAKKNSQGFIDMICNFQKQILCIFDDLISIHVNDIDF